MKPVFKHIGTQGFPHAENVDVYKYNNELNYERYNYTQMKLTICSVPWDMGEAHIGNRTIDGVGNVVFFETKDKRDEWFESIPDDECFRFETKYKDIHHDMTVDIPLPFDIVARFNYLFVEYSLYANDDSPLEYESETGVRKWCYFVRNADSIAPNTSRVELMLDTWQTFIYDFAVRGMILERGHAPMFAMRAEEYLTDPINKNDLLLSEDVNFGDLQQVKSTHDLIFNVDNMRACIVTSANIQGAWTDKTPAKMTYASGVPSFQIFSCEPENLEKLLNYFDENIPQFKQTVQAIFFISSDFLISGATFELGGVVCNVITSNNTQINKDLLTHKKENWNYPEKYADLAKLYTYPYSAIEITNEDGDTSLLKIEDTSGKLTFDVTANLIYPFLNLQAILKGAGGSIGANVKFKNITNKNFEFSGRWYDYVYKWEIPTFGVILDAETNYNFKHKFTNAQATTDAEVAKRIAYRNAETRKTCDTTSATCTYDTTKYAAKQDASIKNHGVSVSSDCQKRINDQWFENSNRTNENTLNTSNRSNTTNKTNAELNFENTKKNADAQANTTYNNATASNALSQSNDKRSAQNTVDNAAAQTTANETNCTKGNEAATSDCNLSNSLTQALQAWDAGYTRDTTNAEVEAKNQSAAVSAAGSMIGGAVSGAMSGATGGPIGAVAGAVSGLVSGGISAATTGAQTAIATNLATTQAEQVISNSQSKTTSNTRNNTQRTNTANNAKIGQKDATNLMITTSAANTAACLIENANDTKTTNDANATRDKSLALDTVNPNNYNTASEVATNNYNTTAENVSDNYNCEMYNIFYEYTNVKAPNLKYTNDYEHEKVNGYLTLANTNAQTTKDAADKNIAKHYETDIANADDIYDNANLKITNAINQAKLDEPLTYGNFSNGENATTKPQGIFANIITQSNSAIKQAGDEFLRYGYRLDQQWDFNGSWNVGKYFTYWKLKDYWVEGNTLQDYYQDAIRFFLMGGVTVWRNPEEIGKVSIYDNF